jgi:type I restriction enzyme R subunit
MRAVKSRTFFEQMKGRGVRVITPDDLKAVTPDATTKDHFVIVDTVGVCEQDKTDARPMEKKPSVAFDKLLQAVALGNTEEDVLTSIAGRLARMEHRITKEDEQAIGKASLSASAPKAGGQAGGGLTLRDLSRGLVEAVNPDRHLELARQLYKTESPTVEQVQTAAAKLIKDAVTPLHDPKLRELLIEIKKKNELTIDHVSQDQVIEAGFSADALARARTIVQSFEQFITQHKDEITALQVLYTVPARQRVTQAGKRLTFEHIKELADAIEKPPYLWNESQLWQAYAALEKSKVKGASGKRILTDLVSLVRFAIRQDNELVPFPERVNANFNAWLAQHENTKKFTNEQRHWLEMIRDHVAANLAVDRDDFEYAPFAQEGGLGKVHRLFPDGLQTIIETLNVALVA